MTELSYDPGQAVSATFGSLRLCLFVAMHIGDRGEEVRALGLVIQRCDEILRLLDEAEESGPQPQEP